MKIRCIVWFLLIPLMGIGQETGEARLGSWLMYFGTHQIADRFSIHSEAQFRYYETVSNFNQLLLRTGLNYKADIKATVTLGYAYIDTDPTFTDAILEDTFFTENDVKEHRIFQQLITTGLIGNTRLEHRYRLEQRFITNSFESFTAHRARYRLYVTYPLYKQWYLSAYNEIFINLQDDVFDQNRLYGALGYKLDKNIRMECGYLKNHFTGRNFDRLQFAVFWNADLRKNKTNSSKKEL